MSDFCKKCKTNWARLWEEEAGDETYLFCPTCKSHLDLDDQPHEGAAFIRCHITGKIWDAETKQELVPLRPKPALNPKPAKPVKVYKTREEYALQQEEAAETFQSLYNSGEHELARSEFFRLTGRDKCKY